MNNTQKRRPAALLARPALLAALPLFSTAQLFAADVIKANNTTGLNSTGSWVGGALPTADDIAVWNSTVTGANTVTLGGNLSLSGLRVDNPGGLVTINANTDGQILALGANGIAVNGANLSIGTGGSAGTLNLAANQSWTIAAGRNLTIGSNWAAMTGSGNLTITGPGSLTLGSGNNTPVFTFGTGAVSIGGGIRLINDATDAFSRTRTITNAVTLTSDITLQFNLNSSGNNVSAFRFVGGLNLGSVDRTLTLSLPNINSTTPGTFNEISQSRTILELDTAGQLTGTGTLFLRNESTAADKVVHVRINNIANAINVPTLDIGSNVILTAAGANASVGANTALNIQSGGIFSLSTSSNSSGGTRTIKSLAGAGTVTNFAPNIAQSVLIIDGGASTGRTEFSGVIENRHALVINTANDTIAITKTGSTTQVFSGANTYTGQTQVNGGALFVNGTHINAAAVSGGGYGSATGHFQVASGATLGGSGRIAGFNSTASANMVLVQSGGILAPGGDNALGTMVLDGGNLSGTGSRVLNMAAGAKFDFTLSGSGGSSDQLAIWNYVNGDVVLNSNAVDLALSGPQVGGTYTVSLFTFYSDAGSSVASSGISSGLTIGTLGEGIESANLVYNGSSIDLTYTVAASTIPEPATAAALLGLVALGGAATRRRRVKHA